MALTALVEMVDVVRSRERAGSIHVGRLGVYAPPYWAMLGS